MVMADNGAESPHRAAAVSVEPPNVALQLTYGLRTCLAFGSALMASVRS